MNKIIVWLRLLLKVASSSFALLFDYLTLTWSKNKAKYLNPIAQFHFREIDMAANVNSRC